MKLDTAERYKFLHRWVIPNESHYLMRTTGAFTPTHPVPPLLDQNPIDVAMAEDRQAVDQRCVQTGGNFVCPAILLTLAAVELGRLDELKKEVDAVNPASSTDAARAHAAMLGIINLLEDAPQQANERIRECHALLVQDKTSPMYSRWGDIALASLAIQHPFTNESINEFETAGRLRLQRKGPVIYYLIAKPDSEDFRLITQRPLGTQDIKHLAINADASDKASGAEFVVKSVSIRAAKLLKLK